MKLIIWGIGGVTSSLISVLEEISHGYESIEIVQDADDLPAAFLGYAVRGTRQYLDACDPEQYHVFAAGSTPAIRHAMVSYLQAKGFFMPTFISPSAEVRRTAHIGQGCLIQSFCLVDHFTHVGDYSLVGGYSIVGHDSRVGAFSSLYVGTRMLGFTEVGERCLLGAGSHLFAYRKMGDGSAASMGAMVFEDVPAFVTVAGNPAQVIKQYTGFKPATLRDLT